MAWSLLRRRRILPLRPQSEGRARPLPGRVGGVGLADDDYLVEGEEVTDQPSTAQRVVHTLQIVLIIILAILSLAIVWLMGLVFNIF
jgi:hypothetical protein